MRTAIPWAAQPAGMNRCAPVNTMWSWGYGYSMARGHILLTRRDASKRYMPGKWENTGGHVVSGEDSPTAAARELAEETGIPGPSRGIDFSWHNQAPAFLRR